MRVSCGIVLCLLAFGCDAGGPAEPPSLLLVTADSLRVDRLRPWTPGSGPATPALATLAERGVVFRNAWAVAPWTAPSVVSVMTGLYPTGHGAIQRDDTTPAGLPTLASLLAARGYQVGNFSFFSALSYFRNLALPDPVPGLEEGRMAEAFATWSAALDPDRPFFAWVHLLDPHLPYGASGYRAREAKVPGSSGLIEAQLRATVPVGSAAFAPGDRDRLLELYDRDLESMDRELGSILQALERARPKGDTVVVFVADHGEELLEDGWVGHASTSIEAKLLPEIMRIPLLLAGPGVPEGRLDDRLVQQVDILPTVLRLLGIEAPRELDGRVLTGASRWFRRGRHLAFFDSAIGGNLTPVERRSERLQGLTDGECLLSSQLAPGREPAIATRGLLGSAGCDDGRRQALLAALDEWRESQARRRLAVLAGLPAAGAPHDDAIADFAEDLTVSAPERSSLLDWHRTQGQIVLEWEGLAKTYWLEYDIGSGLDAVEGVFPAEQSRLVFGPFPPGFWNDLVSYNPFRFRVLDPDAGRRSPWVEFQLKRAS